MSEPIASYSISSVLVEKVECDKLPRKAQNLARRVLSLTKGQPATRITFEVVTVGNRWLLMVNGGQKVEDLGE